MWIMLMVYDENKTIIGLKWDYGIFVLLYCILDENKTIIGLKYTQRYKCCGNAVMKIRL